MIRIPNTKWKLLERVSIYYIFAYTLLFIFLGDNLVKPLSSILLFLCVIAILIIIINIIREKRKHE